MSKLTKRETKLHDEAMELVRNGEELSFQQKEFIIENYKPYAANNVSKLGAFYTPDELAQSLTMYLPEPAEYNDTVRVLDLCAGIGKLAFAYYHAMCSRHENIEIVCIELVDESIEVGKRVLPEATWVQGDVGDPTLFAELGNFHCVISNPPFGKLAYNDLDKGLVWFQRGAYLAAMRAMEVSDYGVFILPQCNCPFEVSGRDNNIKVHNPQYQKFEDKYLVRLAESCIDTEFANDLWDGVSPKVEVAIVTNLRTDPYKTKTPTFSS